MNRLYYDEIGERELLDVEIHYDPLLFDDNPIEIDWSYIQECMEVAHKIQSDISLNILIMNPTKAKPEDEAKN